MVFWGVKIGQKPKKSFFSEKVKCVRQFKKKIGSLAPEVRFLAQVEVGPDFRGWPKNGLGGFFGRFCVKIEQTLKSFPELTRKAMDLIFFLNDAQ